VVFNELARGLMGIATFVGVAWLAAEDKRSFAVKTVALGLAGQAVLAILLLKIPAVTSFFGLLAQGAHHIERSSETGAEFVFGYLSGGPQPFVTAGPAASTAVFAFRSLPAIIFVSALSALLWHWGVLRWLVRCSAWLFGRLFGVSGPVAVSTSACIFLGMIEAPLLVRPLIPKLSRGELFIIMVDGMSVLAGSMMIFLGAMLANRLPTAFAHLLMAATISTPMAICLARSVVPDGAADPREPVVLENHYHNSLDALAGGALVAVKIAVNIVALLIVFIGLVALLDQCLDLLPHSGPALTLAGIFSHVLAPVAWLMGVPLSDLHTVGALLGTKIALNEIVAYGKLAALEPAALTDKGTLIATYALGSFGNLGSVAILIGTLAAMAPHRASEIARLGFKALLVATLTTCLTATCVGMLSSLLS